MRHRRARPHALAPVLVTWCAVILAICVVIVVHGMSHANPAETITDSSPLRGPVGTAITIDGARPGPVFDGVGAISGGGGNSRLLIDYEAKHPQQASQVLDYLFKPGYGAELQILKLEIGGDANATDGSEPSYQHVRGRINCRAGYELWLAKQARKLNPKILIEGLQWNAPAWIGGGTQNAWTAADISYLIGWLNCAKAQGVSVNGIGGWNEHLPHGVTAAVMGWYIRLRAALDRAGFASVKIVGVDSFPHAKGNDVAKTLAGHPAFSAALSTLGYHDVCKHLSTAHRCILPPAALASGKAIWETEIGALQPPAGIGSITRSINNSYIQAGVSGVIEWPMLSAMPADLPVENLGLVRANQPWSGNYKVNRIVWAIAQTTQFTAPGWLHVRKADGALQRGGSYVGYERPDHKAWSLVAQTSDAKGSQTIGVRVSGGLPRALVQVWSTRLSARSGSEVLARQADVHPYRGAFRYQLRPGYIYTFTTTTGQSKGGATPPVATSMPTSYSAAPDISGEPSELAPMDGAFEYLGGSTTTFGQTAHNAPDFWQPPKPAQPKRFPYAVVGGRNWRDYRVAAQVKFTGPGQSAGLIARYDRPSFRSPVEQFRGYELTVFDTGRWHLVRNVIQGAPVQLAAGRASSLRGAGWHALSLQVRGSTVSGRIDGRQVVSLTSGSYPTGIAGIMTGGWYEVLFRNLTVSP